MSLEFKNLRNALKGKQPNQEEIKKLYAEMSDEYRRYVKQEDFLNYLSSGDLFTFLWHDYEAWGANTKFDQASQFASVRTDRNLNVVDIPLDIYCKPSPHRLPHPIAVQITHISPLKCLKIGLPEYEFFNNIRNEMLVPLTNTNAYNGIGYDREMTRFSFYRNLFSAYEHEHANGNSVWDIMMVGAMCRALRPEGIVWPKNAEGRLSIRLEDLASANGVVQENAHNAVDDVFALIDWAKILKAAQPQLWDYLFNNKHKRDLKANIDFKRKIYMHTNMAFGLDNLYTSPILPLFPMKNEPDSVIALNLREDYEWLKSLTKEEIKERLYMKKAELEDKGLTRPPFIKIKYAKCPAIAPFSVLREEDATRLHIDIEKVKQRAVAAAFDDKLLSLISDVYATPMEFTNPTDAEQQLYGFNFFNKSDNFKIKELHTNGIKHALQNMNDWNDPRIIKLLKRVIAKNYPEQLTDSDTVAWKKFCLESISTESENNEITISNYLAKTNEFITDPELKKEYISYVEKLIQDLKT